jgi:large subunit ribosomal protein L15
MMELNQLTDNYGARVTRKRVGRGMGSGLGKTAGKGYKGQKARAGVALAGFEGGQMPLHKRLPKRGFNSLNREKFSLVNLGRLQDAIDRKVLDASQKVTSEALEAAGLVRKAQWPVRLLAKGALKTKLEIEVSYASETAHAAVKKAGGKVVLLGATE